MTDAFDVTLDRAPRRVVVKLYRDGDGTAPLEWSRLEFAQRVAVPVPEPIVADLESAWFGRPAVVMSRLPGRPDLTPKDVDSWVGALGRLVQLACSSDRTSPIASPTHTRASSAAPLTSSPCTTSCVCVLSSRHYLAESLAADQEQGHVPDHQRSVARLDEHVRRSLQRLDP